MEISQKVYENFVNFFLPFHTKFWKILGFFSLFLRLHFFVFRYIIMFEHKHKKIH